MPEHAALLEVWECSVRASHSFLTKEDLGYYKSILPTFFPDLVLFCIKDDSGQILGFTASKDGSLEMLFVRDSHQGMGIGSKLLLHAKKELKISRVDVNLQNQAAAAFYYKHGFEEYRRSDSDSFGKPYPILHLRLQVWPADGII